MDPGQRLAIFGQVAIGKLPRDSQSVRHIRDALAALSRQSQQPDPQSSSSFCEVVHGLGKFASA